MKMKWWKSKTENETKVREEGKGNRRSGMIIRGENKWFWSNM